MKNLNQFRKYFFSLFEEHTRKIFLLLAFLLFSSLIEIIGLTLVIPIIGLIQDPNYFDNSALANYAKEIFSLSYNTFTLKNVLILFITLYIFKFITLIFIYWYQSKFIFDFKVHLSEKMFKHYLLQDFEFHLNKNSSEIIRNIIKVNRLTNAIFTPVIFLTTEIIIITLLFIVSHNTTRSKYFDYSIDVVSIFIFQFTTKKIINKWSIIRLNSIN